MHRIIYSLSAAIFCILQITLTAATAAPEARWLRQTDSLTVFIFVHGIFSDSDAGWRHADGSFWPDLVVGDHRLKDPSIFLGGYPSSLQDPNYEIENAAKHLFGRLNGVGPAGEPSVMSKRQLIFIAHSTGGLVVRQMLVNEAAAFADKKIGLFLLASPSRGSEWATRADGLTRWLGHKMIAQLAANSAFTVRLDRLFSELLARKRVWMIAGMDVFESRFIVPGLLWNREVVVNPDESRYYFGEPRLVPNSDHFSISKPSVRAGGSDTFPHEYLVEFVTQRFEPEVFALSRCKSSDQAQLQPVTLKRDLAQGYSERQAVPIVPVQFSADTPSSGNLDEGCFANKLNALKLTQRFESYGGVRCEGGGLSARSDKKQNTIQYVAPPNMRIVGQATTEILSKNRGEVGPIQYDSVGGKAVSAQMEIRCQSPDIPFGPGAWVDAKLTGVLEQVPTVDQIAEARKSCTK